MISITEAGIYDMPESDYHNDAAPEPSLSSGAAKLIVERSPLHAYNASRRLNPSWEATTSTNFDIGKLMHALILGDEHSTVTVIDAANYRTADAQDARDEAYAEGRIPALLHQYERALRAAQAVTSQLDEDVFILGQPEQSLFWQEGDVWCRARVDWLPDDPDAGVTVDVKSTGNAHPDVFARHLYAMGYDIQAELYLRGIRKLTGARRPTWKFLAIETEAPFACSLVGLQSSAQALSARKVDYAIRTWGRCLRSGVWPGYGGGTYTAEMPAWNEQRWVAREEMGDGEVAAAISWQAPA